MAKTGAKRLTKENSGKWRVMYSGKKEVFS
jgi:hypothetical protein